MASKEGICNVCIDKADNGVTLCWEVRTKRPSGGKGTYDTMDMNYEYKKEVYTKNDIPKALERIEDLIEEMTGVEKAETEEEY